MTISCLNVIDKLIDAINETNDIINDTMTDINTKYIYACVKPNVTYQNYQNILNSKWKKIINNFVAEVNGCSKLTQNLKHFKNSLNAENPKKFVINTLVEYFNSDEDVDFQIDNNVVVTMKNLSNILLEHCGCHLPTILYEIIKQYKPRFRQIIQNSVIQNNLSMQEHLEYFYDNIKKILHQIHEQQVPKLSEIKESLVHQLMEIHSLDKNKIVKKINSFGIENELNNLIPDDFGSLKNFFIKIISEYYRNINPIVWAQIFKSMAKNIFIELPITSHEFYQFISKHLLLNSGPFILKILQMVRPVLTPELAEKYNLTKLTYPLLTNKQVNSILNKCVENWDMYYILANYSASVGHVCKVSRVDNSENIFIIKIIKPISIAQSCWEYKTLHDLFPANSCESDFIKNMLRSNGREMDVRNEIDNINNGHKYYTADYSSVFDIKIPAKLTTVEHIDGVFSNNNWYALAMSLAPGIPLSHLVEQDSLQSDTVYRANLHRCLDLLVYKFISGIIRHKFYHGDLHAGNIFYSFYHNQMTLIDFGAVGSIDIFDNNEDARKLLNIIIMSSYHNYPDLLDTMTDLVNQKCDGQIDTHSHEYSDLRNKFRDIQYRNISLTEDNTIKQKQYKNDMFSEQRIKQEQQSQIEIIQDRILADSIYSYLEFVPLQNETVIENREVLPEFTKIGKSDLIDFVDVFEDIIKFYSKSGVNIAVKLNELYEFQKAYLLLFGVLKKVNYNSHRFNIAVNQAIYSLENMTILKQFNTAIALVSMVNKQKSIQKDIKKSILENRRTIK